MKLTQICAIAALLFSSSAVAQEESSANLALELNALQQAEAGCRVSFLAFNGMGQSLDEATFELALFNNTGAIDRLVTLDFKGLTAGKTKVLQFQLNDLNCDDVSRVLINDVPVCTGENIAPSTCLDRLKTSTRLDVTFGI